jgi:hypothetical protein
MTSTSGVGAAGGHERGNGSGVPWWSWGARALVVVVLTLGALPRPAMAEAALDVLVQRLAAAWNSRDLEGYLALWDSEPAQARVDERSAVQTWFGADESHFETEPPRASGEDGQSIAARVFLVQEPYATIQNLTFQARRTPGGWVIVGRESVGQIEGLIHINLGGQAFRADARTMRFEDLELRMEKGRLFASGAPVGPTAFVFMGSGRVIFAPRPPAERDQLREYSGKETLDEAVSWAFVRVNPRDLEQVMGPAPLVPHETTEGQAAEAKRLFEKHSTGAFVFDTSLPRAPWWTLPPAGKSLVVFPTRQGVLTYAATSQPEGISLMDRARRRHICLYPAKDQPSTYVEDDYNGIEVRHHELRLRLEPDTGFIEGQDTLRMRLRSDAPTLRLRLDGSLTVRSVTSGTGQRLLSFRVRDQHLLMVTVGPWARVSPELEITVRYDGVLPTAHGEVEALQGPRNTSESDLTQQVIDRAPRLYANEPFWYPQPEFGDYATAHVTIDVPAGYQAVTSGKRTAQRVEGKRSIVEYQEDVPSRYLSLIVGRLSEEAQSETDGLSLRGFGTDETRSEVADSLGRAGTILTYFESLFGRCPYPTLSLVLTEAVTPGGHSPPGMTILSRRSLRLPRMAAHDPADFSDFPDFFLAHELAHQWWGHGVAPANYRERWLSEAFAQYAAALWIRRSQGQRAFEDAMDRMAEWARRETRRGPINLGRRIGHVKGEPQVYRAVVYDKGACVLHMLRALVGEDHFFEGLRALQASHHLRRASTDDLRTALERVSGMDLRPYFAAWVEGTTIPEIEWSAHVEKGGGAARTTVSVVARNLPGPVPLELAFSHALGTKRETVQLPAGGGKWTVETPLAPERISVNDDRGLWAVVHQR